MNSFPNRHVGHLLAAYIGGQLPARQVRRVRQHLTECGMCREKLRCYERLAGDLRLTFGSSTPSPAKIDAWWQAICTAPVRRPRGVARLALAPALMSLLLLIVPALAGEALAAPQPAGSTTASLVLDTTIEPPTVGAVVSTPTPVSTEMPSWAATPTPEQRATFTPVPPAPTRDS